MYIRKVLFANKLALSSLLCYMLVKTVLFSGSIEGSLAPATAMGGGTRYILAAGPLDLSAQDYAQIMERNPFGPSASAVDSFGPERSAPEQLGLALFGTISGNPAVARAVIKDLKTGTLELYKTGQTIANARIETINDDMVVLIHNGQRKVLRLSTTPSGSYSDINLRTHLLHSADEISDIVEPDLSTQDDTIRARVKAKHIETILRKAVITPYVVDGETDGLQITGLENIKLAKQFGLKNGDVIRSVNGHRLVSKKKAYQVFKKAMSQPSMDFELLRGDETKKLSLTLR